MLTFFQEFVEFIGRGLEDFAETDFTQVRYGDPWMAWWLATAVLVAVGLTLARLVLWRRKHSRHHSGYLVDRTYQKSAWVKALYGLPKLTLVGALPLLLVAAADPFLTATEDVATTVESRVRVDLVDVSGSMAWRFADTGKSKAEVAREAHLKFLTMRRDKNDRVSLWLFSTYPYMVEDFVTDSELYYFQVWDAPYVMLPQIEGSPAVPRDKIRLSPVEGTTNIVVTLQAVIKQFDQDELTSGHSRGQHRAVLIVTDAAVEEFPARELDELNKRHVVPYIIYINASGLPTTNSDLAMLPLIALIRDYGGDYFDVGDPRSLQKAYEVIDAREAVRYQTTHRVLKVPIYARFLLVGMVCLLIGIPLGFAAELFGGTDP